MFFLHRGRVMRRFREFKKQISPDDITRVAGKLGSMNRGPVKEIWSKVESLWTFIRESDAGVGQEGDSPRLPRLSHFPRWMPCRTSYRASDCLMM